MTYGNGVRDDSQQLRDIQDLIARLEDVNRQLALPVRAMPMPSAEGADRRRGDRLAVVGYPRRARIAEPTAAE